MRRIFCVVLMTAMSFIVADTGHAGTLESQAYFGQGDDRIVCDVQDTGINIGGACFAINYGGVYKIRIQDDVFGQNVGFYYKFASTPAGGGTYACGESGPISGQGELQVFIDGPVSAGAYQTGACSLSKPPGIGVSGLIFVETA